MQESRTIIILLLCVTVALASRRVQPQSNSFNPKDNRVIGGEEAEPGFAPYQISIQGQYDGHMCGGCIVDKQWILTAAHCVDGFNPAYLRIITGTTDLRTPGNTYFADDYYVHEGFEHPFISNQYGDDIALIRLNDTIEFDDFTQAAPLISEPLQDGDDLLLTGWGSTDMCGSAPYELQKITLKYMSHERCLQALSEGDEDMSGWKTIGHICSFTQKGEGSCHGDSGGPLVNDKGELSGLVNWGKPCAQGKPDAHANVYYYRDWIRLTMSEQCKECDCTGSRTSP